MKRCLGLSKVWIHLIAPGTGANAKISAVEGLRVYARENVRKGWKYLGRICYDASGAYTSYLTLFVGDCSSTCRGPVAFR